MDFDGVVVDSLRLHLDAWRAATLALFKKPLTDPDSLIGRGTRAIAGIVAKTMGDPSLAGPLVRAKESWLAEHFALVKPLPGARAMVDELTRRGIPFGIASNSPGAFVRGALAAMRITVKDVVAGDEIGRAKPHPDIYWELANRLGIHPDDRGRILVFEDSVPGLKAALSAGMIGVGVATEQTSAKLAAAGAVAVCDHLADALARGWLDARPLNARA